MCIMLVSIIPKSEFPQPKMHVLSPDCQKRAFFSTVF